MAKKYDSPTDKQINYAKALGIKLPKRATRQDASELIDLAKGERDFGPMFRRFHDLGEHDGYVLAVFTIKDKLFAEFTMPHTVYEEKNAAWVSLSLLKPKKDDGLILLEEYKEVDVLLDNILWHEAVSYRATYVSTEPEYYEACLNQVQSAARKIAKGKQVPSPKSQVQTQQRKTYKPAKRGFRAWVRRKMIQLLILCVIAIAAVLAIAFAF